MYTHSVCVEVREYTCEVIFLLAPFWGEDRTQKARLVRRTLYPRASHDVALM